MRATILYILELSKHHLFPSVNSMRGFTRSEMKVRREKNDSNDGEREKKVRTVKNDWHGRS